MSKQRYLVGFPMRSTTHEEERVLVLFENMFEPDGLRGPFISCSELYYGEVELYYRFSNYKGRGEHSYDDYSDYTLAQYDLREKLQDPDISSYVSSLISNVNNDGAITVPVSRHPEFLHYLLWNESCIWSCTKSYFLKSKLLRAFLDYDFIVLNDSDTLAITKKRKSIAEYEYKAISSYIGVMRDHYYPCCLNLKITQALIEHPETLIRVNNLKDFRFVMINLNTLYQRRMVLQTVDLQLDALKNGLSLKDINTHTNPDAEVTISESMIMYPDLTKVEEIALDYCTGDLLSII